MRKYISQILILILFNSCNPSINDLKGTWSLRRHEYFDFSKNSPLIKGDKPFTYWDFSDASFKIDGQEEYFSIEDNEITITYQQDFKHFEIMEISESSMLLKSEDLTPGQYSFYYFLK